MNAQDALTREMFCVTRFESGTGSDFVIAARAAELYMQPLLCPPFIAGCSSKPGMPSRMTKSLTMIKYDRTPVGTLFFSRYPPQRKKTTNTGGQGTRFARDAI